MSPSDTHLEIYNGGCHCEAIRYAATGHPEHAYVCHCDDCRRLNGGVRMAGALFRIEQLSVVGTPKRYSYRGATGEVELHFCDRCSTPLFAYSKERPVVVVRINSLDDQNVIPPQKAMSAERACAWDRVLPQRTEVQRHSMPVAVEPA